LQNNLNRWYDPSVGRWLSEDPIGFAGGDGNVYRYVLNAPTDYVDPLGFQAPVSIGIGIEYHPTYVAYARAMIAWRQCMLNYYHNIMREMLRVGDALHQSGPAGLGRLGAAYSAFDGGAT
jgi:uncharacterized protein RhaS with RHS repeats